MITASCARNGRSRPTQPPRRRAEVHRLLGRLADAHPRRPAAPRATRRRQAARDRAVALRRLCAHAAAPADSCERDDLGVRRARLEQLVVACRRPTTAPSSSTTIWSASTMVETRCATTITAASATTGAQRRAQPRVGAEVERRERVVEQVDLRLPHERARDREPLALAAGDVRAALGDRRVRPLRHRRDEVARLRDLEERATARRRSRRGCRSGGCSRPCPRTGTASAARSRSAAAARRAPTSRTSTPSTSTSPSTTSNRRGISDSSVVLPAPVLPMIAVVRPARRRQADVAQHRHLGAGIAERDAAQLDVARAAARSVTRSTGGDDRRVGLEHLADAVGATPPRAAPSSA